MYGNSHYALNVSMENGYDKLEELSFNGDKLGMLSGAYNNVTRHIRFKGPRA